MVSTTTIVSRLGAYLRNHAFTPALREVVEGSHSPPSAYPHLAIVMEGGSFSPHGEASYHLLLRLGVASGRSAEAQAALRSLAAQLQTALSRAGNLGGSVRALRTSALRFNMPGGGDPLVAWAELDVDVDAIQ